MKPIAYSIFAVKQLRCEPPEVAERLMAEIARYYREPASFAVRPLADSPYLSLQIGGREVVLDEHGTFIHLIKDRPAAAKAPPPVGTSELSAEEAEAEFSRLEDQITVVVAELSTGWSGDVLVPPQIAERILAGEDLIQLWLAHLGLSPQELASRVAADQYDLPEVRGNDAETVALAQLAFGLGIETRNRI